MNSLIEELKGTEAEIHFDEVHKRIYSVDASIFEIVPIGIAIPKTKDALLQILKIAKKHKIAVIARGAATGIAGGCIGKALIIDLSKYLNNILSLNIEEEYAVVEPGVVQDQLNASLKLFDYRLGPDTSTGNRATIGGMAANDSAGARSLHYGKMDQHLLEVELALSSGELIKIKPLSIKDFEEKAVQNDAEGFIYKRIKEILKKYDQEIKTGFPKLPRRVSGYNLDLVQENEQINICKLIAGSEGTLGIITEMKVKICKKPKATGIAIIHFHEMLQGMQTIPFLLSFSPIALEMIDNIILNTGLKKNEKPSWLKDSPYMVFIAEFTGEEAQEVETKLKNFKEALLKEQIGYATVCLNEKEDINSVWNLRKAGLGLLLSKKSYNRAIAFIEDLSIPPNRLYSFMEKFQAYMEKIGKAAGIYGHIGSGCMHIRPYIDLRKQEEVELMKKIMLDVTDLVLEHGGVLSGEHGDGLIRSWLTEKCFGEKLYQAFIEIKLAFDPENRMNPGKIVWGELLLKNLRLTPETRFANIKTFLDFKEEGGFDLAVDLCNGNGLCRKKEGTMCPSFQATNDEYDTTRARAQTLRA
ncbi:MAG TPA: FAD-binding oxidoreductase, partial [Parachlamydiaceae bacterium]|nr:FAD-binding oxidoreductase [Parachlamydiaceae bacterium]